MGKVIIELISSFYSITGNSETDSILFAIAGVIALSVAFNIVGMIFDALGFYDSSLMSNTHWIIRIFIFISITWIFKQVFKLINWICSFQWWIYLIIVLVIVLFIIALFLLKHKRSQRQFHLTDSSENTTNNVDVSLLPTPELTSNNHIQNNRYTCPRCGEMLVKRVGPYGGFWGCDGFPKCKYTRSFR